VPSPKGSLKSQKVAAGKSWVWLSTSPLDQWSVRGLKVAVLSPT